MYLSERKVFVDEKSHDGAGDEEVGQEEGVVLLVVRVGVRALEFHQVHDQHRGTDENTFHHTVVQGHEVVEQVQVAGDEDEGIQELSFERYTYRA